jgi:integrase/recombinase XerC
MELHEHLALAGAALRLPRSAFAPHVRPRALGAPALPAAAGPGGGDGALLALLAAGLRSGEVCALDVEDVLGDGATLTVSGHGGVRELPLDGRLSELLAVVVAGRSSGPLFTGPGRGGRLDERALRRRVSAAAPDGGVHELRAWAVRSAAAQRGADSGS